MQEAQASTRVDGGVTQLQVGSLQHWPAAIGPRETWAKHYCADQWGVSRRGAPAEPIIRTDRMGAEEGAGRNLSADRSQNKTSSCHKLQPINGLVLKSELLF